MSNNIIEQCLKELVTKFGLTVKEENTIRSKFLEIYEEAYFEGRESVEYRFTSYGKKEDYV